MKEKTIGDEGNCLCCGEWCEYASGYGECRDCLILNAKIEYRDSMHHYCYGLDGVNAEYQGICDVDCKNPFDDIWKGKKER